MPISGPPGDTPAGGPARNLAPVTSSPAADTAAGTAAGTGPETAADTAADIAEVEGLVAAFLGAFASGPGTGARMAALRALFVPGAVIVRTCGSEPQAYDVDAFIAPREALLSGGRLVGFREWEVSGRTEVFGDLAHHLSTYAKSGTQDGQAFTGRGVKSVQCVRTSEGWRISAVVWDDEREGWTMTDPLPV